MRAVVERSLETVKLLLGLPSAATLLEARSESGHAALAFAVFDDEPMIEIVRELVEAGADVNTADDEGITPLAWEPDTAIAQLLLDHGADCNHADSYGDTPLSTACVEGRINVVELMLSRGGNINTRARLGMTLLMLAAMNGHVDVVDLLLDRGASVNDRDNDGATALYLAVENNHIEVVRRLIAAGADVSIADADMATPLMTCEDAEIGALLLDHGADMYETDMNGHSSIMHACKLGNNDMLSLFINRGADVFRPTEAGDTGLLFASFNGHEATVNMLLQTEGVTKQWIDTVSGSSTALSIAVEEGRSACVAALIAFRADVNLVPALRSTENHEIIKMLLEAGAVDSPAAGGWTALMLAASDGRRDAVKLLLEHKSDIEAASADGFTPLIWATMSGGDSIPMLLDAGADPRAADNHGRVPLMHVFFADSFSELAEAAPDTVSHRDLCGRTVFHHYSASRAKHGPLAQLCECVKSGEHQIDINDRDDNGDTALHMAMADSNSGAVELLLENGAEVLGSGYEGSTVLMKPFLGAEVISRVYEGLVMSRDEVEGDDGGEDGRSEADRSTCTCLCLILDGILGKKTASQGSRGRRRGNGEAVPAAKKRRA
jgi:ankyrin repeat protein